MIKIISDLHLEFHQDGGKELINSLGLSKEDILVIAGDLTCGSLLVKTLTKICGLVEHVVFVAGNHEHFGRSFDEIDSLSYDIDNLCWLENSWVFLGGRRFVGCTLWFPKPCVPYNKNQYADFGKIQNFESEVYNRHWVSKCFLKENLQKGDILVTHFLPFAESIAPQFAGSPSNQFFWAGEETEQIILNAQPEIVVHGHTHTKFDYVKNGIRVVCNPYGYPGENRAPSVQKISF